MLERLVSVLAVGALFLIMFTTRRGLWTSSALQGTVGESGLELGNVYDHASKEVAMTVNRTDLTTTVGRPAVHSVQHVVEGVR